MSDELKPCPWCGGDYLTWAVPGEIGHVTCSLEYGCGARGPMGLGGVIVQRRWNRRPAEDTVEALDKRVLELEAENEHLRTRLEDANKRRMQAEWRG